MYGGEGTDTGIKGLVTWIIDYNCDVCSEGEVETGCCDLFRQQAISGGFPEQVTFKTRMINENQTDEEKEQEDSLQRPWDGIEPGTIQKHKNALCDWREGEAWPGTSWRGGSNHLMQGLAGYEQEFEFYSQVNEKSWRILKHEQIYIFLKKITLGMDRWIMISKYS